MKCERKSLSCYFIDGDEFTMQVEPQKCSIYREQAVNSISDALDASLNNDIVREKCCRALFILAGHFSSTAEILTKNSILKEAGYKNDISKVKTANEDGESILWHGAVSLVSFLSYFTLSSVRVFLCVNFYKR